MTVSAIVPRVLQRAGEVIRPPGTSLPWFQWCLANAIGGGLGGVLSALIGLVLGGVGNWAAFGAAVGIMQWFALQGYLSVGPWWAVASAVGWALFNLGGAWGWVVAGLAVGLLQGFSLNEWPERGWWIIANLLAWPVAGWIGITVGLALMGPAGEVITWIVGWTVVGLMGGIILVIPLSRMSPKKSEMIE